MPCEQMTKTTLTWNGKPVRGVLLDMDGTIVDTREAHVEAWKLFTAEYGIDVDEEEFLNQYFGLSIDMAVRKLFPNKSPEEVYEIGEYKESRFRAMIAEGHIKLVAGFPEFLRRIGERGLPVALVSSAPRANIEEIVRHFGLEDDLAKRFSADDVEHAKPAPDLFLKGAEEIGIAPEDCVVFEDSRPGFEAGRRAGCRTIAITTVHPAETLTTDVDLAVRDFATLLEHPDWSAL